MSAETLVLDLLVRANKPFGLQGIVDMLATQGVKKTSAQKAVDALTEAGKVVAKEFGKTKIYVAPQSGLQVLSKEETDEIKTKHKAVTEELQAELGLVKSLEQELSEWRNSLTAEEMATKIQGLTAKLVELQDKVTSLSSGAVLISPEERAKVEKAFTTNLEAWRKRRGMFKEIWGTILEGLDGKPSELLEEIGVETDEAIGADYKALEAALPKKRRL